MPFWLFLLFAGGAFLSVFNIPLYRVTVVPVAALFLGGIIVSAIFTVLTRQFLLKFPDTQGWFSQFIINAGIFGGTVVYAFLSINYHFPRTPTVPYTEEVVGDGLLPGYRNSCRRPYLEIEIRRERKVVLLPCGAEVNQYRYVGIERYTGYFGFVCLVRTVPLK